ncbi:CotD family spore coat protein [Solibacillus sp. CAU 1738]|uniref:CotD family spore coat protein n=1 Tax=Solibacillus sp. CAU 1738 TaxID=3140363 RepID=UPI0032607473
MVSPTRQFVQTNVSNTVVPHIHPSHTTIVNRHNINNQHFFPHTQSVVNECHVTNTKCGMPYNPCKCHPRKHGF